MEKRRWSSREGGKKKVRLEGGRREESGARGKADEKRWGSGEGGRKKESGQEYF